MTDEIKTTEVPRDALIQFAHRLAMESDDHEILMPGDVPKDEFYESFKNEPWKPDTVEVEIVDEETVSIRNNTYVMEVVGYIPATRWNPPEHEMEEREMIYEIQLDFGGLGDTRLRAEPV